MIARLKLYARNWIPPVILQLFRSWRGYDVRFSGNFTTWEKALHKVRGYDAPDILTRVVEASCLVKSGEALFDRDGVLFYEPNYPYSLIAGLLRVAALHHGRLSVVDFGGALGSTYNQCKIFLENFPEVKWCVVEQQHFVQKGREEFSGAVLTYADSIDEACAAVSPNVIIFSGVLQYLPDPWAMLRQAIKCGVHSIIIDRTPVIAARHDKISLQIVPKRISSSSYPIRLFTRESLLNVLAAEYRLLVEFEALDGTLGTSFHPVPFRGFILERLAK